MMKVTVTILHVDGNISVTTKARLMKALIWPVATYGCEGTTIKQLSLKKEDKWF